MLNDIMPSNTSGIISSPFMDKRLLVISHTYKDFIKDPVECLPNYFNRISCCVRYNPFARFMGSLPFQRYRRYRFDRHIDISEKPDNIDVYATPVLYGPTENNYKNAGDRHYKSVERTIMRYGIAYDLIHAHILWTAGHVGMKLKEKYDKPLVVTAHGHDILIYPFKDEGWKDRSIRVLEAADMIITVSDNNLAAIRKLNVKKPVRVIPNGYSSKFFYPMDQVKCRKRLGLPLDKKIILSVGDLTWLKGFSYLIEAMPKIITHDRNVICIIVGSGELREKFIRRIKSLGLSDNIRLVGYRPHEEIPLWINACDIFTLPSLSEGNPVVLVESLACGRPFIGTIVGGIPEIIKSEDHGLLIKPEDSDDLALKLIESLNKKWDHEEILRFAKRFSWENITRETLNVYEEVIGVH